VKILHVEGGRRLYGGAQQVLYLVEGLAARGHANVLACPRKCDLARAAAPFAEVHGMRMGGDADLTLALRLAGLIRRTRPDLVHLHSRIGADVWGGVAARLTGVPVVHTRRVDNPERRWLVAAKYRLHDRVIAISECIGQVLLSEGLPEKKLRVVRSAVDWKRWATPCDRQEIKDSLKLPEDSLLIGVVAQLIPRKGHRFLLDALPPLMETHPQLHVRFFGQGPLAKKIASQITRLGLRGRVALAGFRDDLSRVLPCLDVLVHPATMEGLGVSLLQAASAGVPILATRVGGIPEAVHDWVNGILVHPGDTAGLQRALTRLVSDAGLRRRLGHGGQELMQREFSIDVMVEGNLGVYRELVEDIE